MTKLIIVISLLFFSISSVFAQNVEKLKIRENEIPKEYKLTDTDQTISIQARIFYENPEMYSMFIGKVKSKEIQNFEGQKDSGSIMYFEFEENFTADGFLKGLIWGQSKKSTKEHPEQIFISGNKVVIWSFKKDSELMLFSKSKVESILK